MSKLTDIPIIYQDNHLLVAEKPQGVLTQGDKTNHRDLLSHLKEYIKEKHNKPGNVFLGMVHRLDRSVGGVIVFAKTSKAASRLSELIRNREFKKTYLAVVRGIPDPLNGRMKHFLLKDRKSNIVRIVSDPGTGKEAVLDYRTVGWASDLSLPGCSDLSLLEIELITGRPHQVRVQLSGEGYPIFGDSRYGPQHKQGVRNIALWSHTLSFKHPTRDETMCFKSYPPRVHPWVLFEAVWQR